MDEFWRFLNDDNHLCIICLVAAIVFNWNEPEIWKWPASYHDLETNEVHMHGLYTYIVMFHDAMQWKATESTKDDAVTKEFVIVVLKNKNEILK